MKRLFFGIIILVSSLCLVGCQVAIPPFFKAKTPQYNKAEFLSDDEFIILGGVRLCMTYEEVMEIIGDYDDAYDDIPSVKSVFKDGYHLCFYFLDESFGYYVDGEYIELCPELERNDDYYLLNIFINDSGADGFIRDLKIGDSVESVFAKFPFDEPGNLESRHLYGEDKLGKPRAFLERISDGEYYRILLTTTTKSFEITFNGENKIERMFIAREDG